MNVKKDSKFLSLVLRHQPQIIGLTLDEAGWADVDELLMKCASAGHVFDRARLMEIVTTNDKQRFTLAPDGTRIRAAQGHSIAVAMGLMPLEPPPVLYHGTASRFLPSICAQGLLAQSRQQVHLSATTDVARRVASRSPMCWYSQKHGSTAATASG